MKSMMIAVVAAAGIAAAGLASAAGEEELAQKSGCMTCHALDVKKMGPAFKDIAAKYKGKADAQAKLTEELTSGKGHTKVKSSPEDTATLVKWVLAM